MKITLVGNFNCDTLECSYKDAFQKLGNIVQCIDTRNFKDKLTWWLRNRIIHRLTINHYFLRTYGADQYNQTILNQVIESSPSFVLIFGGEWLLPQSVEILQKHHIRVAIINGDNPYAPHYASRPEMLPVAKVCDAYLIWSELLAKRLRMDGAAAHFLPFAWDEAVFPYLGEVNQYESKVSFIGGWDQEREQFLNMIAKHFPLKIWGHDYWQKRSLASSLSRKAWQGVELRSSKAAYMIAHSKINLNILRDQHHTDGVPDGVIMRTFEVPGAGGFSMANRSGGAKEILVEGRDVGYFANAEECLNQIEYYLSHEKQRREIALHGHNLVATEHRYEHRAHQIINIVCS